MKKILSLIFTLLAIAHLQGNNINWSSPPQALSSASINASSAVIAMDANGNSVAAWVENNHVKASSHLFNGNWTSAVTVSGSGASSPKLVMDSTGNATLIWIGNGQIFASTKTLGGSWSTPIGLSNNNASSPTLAVDATGDVVAAWVRVGNIEAAIKVSGMTWQNRVVIGSTSAAVPSVAIGGSGSNKKAVLLWQGTSKGSNLIYASTRLLAGNWTTPLVLSNTAHNATNPQAAVDSNANGIAVWYEYDVTGNSYTDVSLRTSELYSSSSVWSSITTLSTNGIRNPSDLSASVAFDGFGNALAFWNTSFDDETFTILSAVKPVNGKWSDAVDLVDSNLFAFNQSAAVTRFGATVALYLFYNGSSLMILSAESNINGFMNNVWSTPVIVSTGNDNAYPKVAATISGDKIYSAAVWENFGGSFESVLAITGSKTLVLPPSNLVVTQSSNNFGVFTEYSNTLSWTASTDPNAVGYLIFRNGLFVEQVGADQLSFIDYNRALNGSVTYSVATIDAQQTQSAAVSVNFP